MRDGKSALEYMIAFVIAIGAVIFALALSVLIAVLISAGTIWAIDALCGTDFYNWKNVGLLSIVLLVTQRMRSGKTE